MSEKHYVLDLKSKNKLHLFGVPEAVFELMDLLEVDRETKALVPSSSSMFYVVESQAGAGSEYSVFPIECKVAFMDRVIELDREAINHHIYKVVAIEQLELIPARIKTIPINDPLVGGE
jgi:hypothetical protein